MNVNLPRWVFSSLAEHFRVLAATVPIRFFVEGVDEEEALDFQQDSMLFRMDGPIAYQSSGGEEWYKIEIQVLLTDLVATTLDNAYDIYSWAGIVQGDMLNSSIPIYRYGSGVEDDDSLIGCLEPDTSVENNVRVASYGMIDKDWRVKQVSVNGKFVLAP
ncbi:MAG: hypothetical protein ACYSW8_27835 [Planctomycetota bacterium]|jgi:hypothetical protein